MDISYILSFILIFMVIFFEDVHSVSVTVDRIPSTADIQIGNNQVQFRCTYTFDSSDQTIVLQWQKESPRGSANFKTVALFYKPNGGVATFSTTEEGLSFENRSSLTNPTSQSLTAVLTVNNILCEDEGLYRCKYSYLASTGLLDIERDISLDTKAPGDTPYTKPTMSKTADTIEEGDSVTFTCTANVGKPTGRIRWWKYRSTVNSASEILAASPSPPTLVPGVCEYNITSTMTTQLTKDDNNARIRCSVDQELIPGSTPENKAFMETDSINVFYKVGSPTISKVPNSNEYQVGENRLDLTCSVEGNPNPATATDVSNFTWYYKSSDNDNETMATDVNNVMLMNGGRTIRISSLVEEQAGIYICQAQNGFNNKIFQESSQIQVTIVKTTTTTTTTPATSPSSPANKPTPGGQGGGPDDSGLGGGIIAAIVIVVIVVIVLIVVAIVCVVMKRRNKDDSIEEPSEKPRNNHLTAVNQTNMLNDKNSPFYQHSNQYEKNYNKDLQYADLTFDNKPRSRNPMVLNELDTSNLDNHQPYSQVMMPSV